MKEDLLIRVSSDSRIYANEEGLYLPQAIVDIFRTQNILSARAILSYTVAFPSATCSILGVDRREARKFRAQVLLALRGILPKSTLVKRRPRKVAYGGMLPKRNDTQ